MVLNLTLGESEIPALFKLSSLSLELEGKTNTARELEPVDAQGYLPMPALSALDLDIKVLAKLEYAFDATGGESDDEVKDASTSVEIGGSTGLQVALKRIDSNWTVETQIVQMLYLDMTFGPVTVFLQGELAKNCRPYPAYDYALGRVSINLTNFNMSMEVSAWHYCDNTTRPYEWMIQGSVAHMTIYEKFNISNLAAFVWGDNEVGWMGNFTAEIAAGHVSDKWRMNIEPKIEGEWSYGGGNFKLNPRELLSRDVCDNAVEPCPIGYRCGRNVYGEDDGRFANWNPKKGGGTCCSMATRPYKVVSGDTMEEFAWCASELSLIHI